ncbi:MAG: hypothetical protein ACOCXP_01685 [Candidatus Dojkabacteria bacterium]
MDDKLVKLIDYSLLPFSLTILGKTVGLYISFYFLGIDWGIGEFSNSFISVTPIVYGRDLGAVSTYSNLFMFLLIFLGAAFLLLIQGLRKKSLVNTRVLRMIMQLRLNGILQKSALMHARIFVWMFYLWLVSIYILFDALLGRTDSWLAAMSMFMSLLLSANLFADISREYERLVAKRQNLGYI